MIRATQDVISRYEEIGDMNGVRALGLNACGRRASSRVETGRNSLVSPLVMTKSYFCMLPTLLVQMNCEAYSAAASPKAIVLLLTLRSLRKGIKVSRPKM